MKKIKDFIVEQTERIKTMYEVLIELIEYKVVLDKSNEIIHGYRLDDWNLN